MRSEDVMRKNERLRLQDLTEPELREFFDGLMEMLQICKPDDVIGWMLIGFQDDGISQYVASIDPETAPQALRELADRIERRETVKR